MKEYRLLLHWHPQGSYIGRAIFHAFKYAKKAERIHVGILVGSNFMAQTNFSSIEFIRDLVKDNNINKRVSFELITLKPELWNFSVYISQRGDRDIDIYKGLYEDLFLNSVSDSLGRGLEVCYDNKDYMVSNSCKKEIEVNRMKYATVLIENYTKIIKEFNPDMVAISHGTYDHYVSVYIAARRELVPVLVVNGGCNMAYVCNTSSDNITDPCIANAFSEIVKLYKENKSIIDTIIPDNIKTLITNASNRYLPNSSSGILSKSKVFEKGTHISKPLAILPVFAELNHHNCLQEVEFVSRYEWLEWCFKLSLESNRELILYAHPQTSAYGQDELTEKLVKNAGVKYPTKYRLLRRLDELLDESSRNALVPITMASSVSLELNMLGKISCVSNFSTSSHLDCNVKYGKKDNYLALEERFFKRKDVELDASVIDTADRSLKFNSYNKLNSQDFYIRKAFEKLIWFGSNKQGSVNSFVNLLEQYIDLMEVIELPTDKFIQLIPY